MVSKKTSKVLCILLSLLILCVPFAGEALSTGSHYEQEPVAVGTGGAVATEHPEASQAAIDIMHRGGNAIDAAVAAAAVQNLTRPFSGGIGGGGMMNVYHAETDEVITLVHRSMAPEAFDIGAFEDEHGNIYPQEERQTSARAVGVPGTVLAWEEALQEYGTMTFEEVLEPAIALAREGFIIDDNLHREMTENRHRFKKFQPSTDLFLTEEGEVPEAGTVFTNPDLARTFELIAEHGSEVFYNGEIGQAIVDTVNHPPVTDDHEFEEVLPGEMTMEDLAAYEVVTGEPIHTTYRGYDVYGMPLVSSGGLLVGQILNMLEGYDIEHMSETEYLHHFIEAVRLGFADRDAYHADPTQMEVPIDGLISKNYAAERRQWIDAEVAAVGKVAPGDPWPFDEDPYREPAPRPEWETGFTYEFTGDTGGEWDQTKFFTDTSYDTTYELDGHGFGRMEVGGREFSAGRAASYMTWEENKELVTSFNMENLDGDRRLRLWLRADGFNLSASPHHGYAVEFRSGDDEIHLLNRVGGSGRTIARIPYERTEDEQMVRFKVVDNQLSVKVWNKGEEEPDRWNLVHEDDSVTGDGRLLISTVELAGDSTGGAFNLGPIHVQQTDERTEEEELAPGFSYDFAGAAGDPWDNNHFLVNAADDATVELDGDGFGQIELADRRFSYGNARAEMRPAVDMELLVPFRINEAGPSRDLRFWLRGDDFATTVSPHKGYGVDIRSHWNSIRLIKRTDGEIEEIARFNHAVTEQLQWLRFRVEGNQLFVKVWPDGQDEPDEWNLMEEDHTITEPGRLLIGAYETRDDEGAGSFSIGPIEVEELEEISTEETSIEETSPEESVQEETIHLTVADEEGNIVAYTNTIVSIGGSGLVVPGYGFLLNDVLGNRTRFSADVGEPNSAAPHMKPLSTMSPTIIMKDGEPVFAGGAPGGLTIITTVTKIIVSYLDRGMSLPEAVEAARLYQPNFIAGITEIEPVFTATEEYAQLQHMRHMFEVTELVQGIGAFTGIGFSADGQKEAVAEAVRRGGGSAMAYDAGQISIDDIRLKVEEYTHTGDIRGPLILLLNIRLNQAEYHYNYGRLSKAVYHMEKFVEHMNDKAMQRCISEAAKEDLENDARTLIEHWEDN